MIVMMTFASTTSIGPVKRYFLAFSLPMNLAMLTDLLLHGGEIYYLAAVSLLFSLYFSIRSSSIHLQEYSQILRDEARANRLQRHFEHLASTDPLTGIPNRYKFFEFFEKVLKETKKEKGSFVLFFLDLDHFKNINDSYGHDVGDRVLKTIGRRLKELVRERGMAARLAGDEFVILLREARSETEIETLVTELHQLLSRPIGISDTVITIHASIGIVRYPDHGDNPHDLLRHADTAMYRSKFHNRPQWYCDM
jgi:diguanylate cyclase (GGDEF)-like protein